MDGHIEPVVARGFGPRWLRLILAALALAYLANVFFEASGNHLARHFPRAFRYFSQVACLFPRVQTYAFDYRAEAFSCRDHRFHEIDTRPYFPVHPNDKENRYHRLMYFYRNNGKVMHALDDYLVSHHNARVAGGGDAGDGVAGPIGGVLLLDVRIPIPPPGTPATVWRRKPLATYPYTMRKYWYKTPSSIIKARCRELEGGGGEGMPR